MPKLPLVVASMIVKDEAKNLPDLFASCAGLVDAWVIVDTGSTDDTVEVAHNLGGEHRVPIHMTVDPWDDDFARSRNVGLDLIDHLCAPAGVFNPTDVPLDPWIVILDGDDRVVDGEALYGLLSEDRPPVDAIMLPVVSTSSEGRESTVQPRVFRRSAGIRYKYPVHLTPDFTPEHRVGSFTDTSIRHTGYAEDGHTRNAERTIRLARAKLPEGHPHRTYVEARALATLGRWDEALAVAHAGIHAHREARKAGDPEGVLTNVNPWIILARALLLQGEDVAALRVLAQGLSQGESYALSPDAWVVALQIAALGLYGRASALALGSPGVSAVLDRVPGILTALTDSGVLDSGLDLTALRVQAARIRGMGSRAWEGGWPSRGAPRHTAPPKTVLVVASRDVAGQASGLVAALREHTGLEVSFVL